MIIFSLKGNVQFSTHMEVAMLMKENVSQESIKLVHKANISSSLEQILSVSIITKRSNGMSKVEDTEAHCLV